MKRTPSIRPLSCHNVLEFGADRDGKTDSSGAIQNALAEAMEGPCRSVYLPDGTYRVDSGLILDKGGDSDVWNIHVFSDGGATLLAKAGITVFTVAGPRFDRFKTPGPRRVHFRRLHLVRAAGTTPDDDPTQEIGFYLAAPECRLDDVEVSEFRGAGVKLRGAYLTSLHRCRLWHNGVSVADEGDSQASELVGCRLNFAKETGLVWNSKGLTVLGGAIELNAHQEVTVGTEADAIARFYGVHFEHQKNDGAQIGPMIVCGQAGKPGNVQAVFDRCIFMGNETKRPAIAFYGVNTCEVIATRFENFDNQELPIQQADPVNKVIIRDPVNIPHKKRRGGK